MMGKEQYTVIDMSYTQVEEFGTGIFYNGAGINHIKFPKCTKKLNSNGSFTFFSAVGLADTTIDFSLCEQIPVINGTDLGFMGNGYKIIVPEALYDQWIEADVWKKYAGKIVKG